MVSKSEVWMLEKDLCRCCHAEGAFINLATPNTFRDREEIYSDMLRTCFDIEISPVPGSLCNPTYTICSVCVDKLREATTFKEQVLNCEEKFYTLLTTTSVTVPTSIKKEHEISIEEFNVDMADDDTPDSVDDIDFKLEPEETVSKEIPSKCSILRQRLSQKEPVKEAVRKKKAKTKTKAQKKTPKIEKNEEKKDTEKKGTRPKFFLRPGDFQYNGGIYTCSRCNTQYNKVQSLRYHVRSKHYRLPRYKCQYCDQEFMTLPPFLLHKLKEHNIDDRYECSACQTKFNSPSQLRKHINVFHMLGEKYKCQSCDYESFSFEALYKHKFKHKTVKDYHCRFCKKAFLRKATLELHERIHTGDRRKVCKVCGQAFVQKASLNYHMTKYHPDVNF